MRHVNFCFALVAVAALAACDVNVKDEGKLPSVDMDVNEGRMPNVEVTPPSIDVQEKPVEVQVPDVDVSVERKTVTVPDIDVTLPKDE